MKPTILVITPITEESRRQLDRAYQVIEAQDPDSRSRAVEEHGADIRAIVTEGPRPIGGEMIRALPNLELISAMSVGLDAVDLDAARAANIVVTNGRGGNADSVADLAITLMLSVYRQISVNQKAMRDSGGEEHIPAPMTMTASGKAMGIVGLGDIGSRIAKRAGGFGISVRYHNRNRRGDVDYEYLESAEALAAVSDVLVLSCPASFETGNLVNAGVLGALPSTGIVVNVARGSVLDSAALLAALEAGKLAGAGLDVLGGAPRIKAKLVARADVVATPHIAGNTVEAQANKNALMLKALCSHFAGGEVPNRVI